MALFGNKNEQPQAPSPNPIDIVNNLKNQGFSNNQIIQAMQRDGFKSHEIFDALNQAETTTGGPVNSNIPPPPTNEPQMQAASPVAREEPMQQQNYGYQEQQPYGYEQPMQNYQNDYGRNNVEEIAEAIIEEKWQEFIKSVNKILEWKEGIDARFTKVEEQINQLKADYDKLHKGVLGKISEYDRSVADVGTEVKALGKTFEKILPTLTENVSELSMIASKMKKKK